MTLLGFGASGCSLVSDDTYIDDDVVAEYGCPHVTFQLSARVVDEEGTPIKGIEVYWEGAPLSYDDNASDAEGNIHIVDASIWPESLNEVEFVDPDGAENGGEFETLKVDISSKVEMVESGEGTWYQGRYKAVLGDVTMTLKKE